jgi:Transposase DDE domain.
LGQYFVYRYKVGTAVFTETGEPLDLLQWLAQVETVGDCRVWLGAQARVPVRVVAFRLSEASVNRARRRLYAYAGKKDGKPSQRALALADWVVLITHVPEELLSARAVWVLARVRWQVEIVFRVWTSCFRIDECRSRKVWRVLCELYAKLMGVVLWHWLLLVYRGGVWDRSLYKASCAFRRLSTVLCVCLRCGGRLRSLLGCLSRV